MIPRRVPGITADELQTLLNSAPISHHECPSLFLHTHLSQRDIFLGV